ncbi:MAG TPA: NAD-dependent epimerase/dehydratase family protein [Polyangia bacterium]|jgi:nucleoside-diphosphate-sugar epimerase|nr:NAD-dependent epimerase/dehydratase family protein [Polyangia bacterium]
MSGAIALVTGVTSNVGGAVASRLAREGWRVRGLVRGAGTSPVGETARGDLVDRGALLEAARGAELVAHCAAEFSDDVDACRRSNIEGVANVVDAVVAGGCRRLVHISTISVYDDAAGPDYDEESPHWSQDGGAYPGSKAESERIIAAAVGRGLDAVILRPGLIVSMHPRSRWGPQAIARAAASPDSILPFPELPYVHVDNLAEAVVLAARVPGARGRAYNVIDGIGTGSDYLAAVYAAAGRPAPPIPPEAPVLRFRSQRIRDELGYAPIDRWQGFLAEIRSYRRR